MGNINRTFALILTLIITVSCLTLLAVKPASTQTIPKPSVPEFTVKYVDRSFTVPANYTYATNPYTGEQVKTGYGEYRVDNKTIELTIKNQNLTPYKDPITQKDYLLCYNISWKGQYENTWQYYLYSLDSYSQPSEGNVGYGLIASESDYTTIVFGLGQPTQGILNLGELPANSQIDFRVEALFGYYTSFMHSWVAGFRPTYDWVFTGTSSNWSIPQTTVLPTSSPSPIPNSLNSILENQQLTNIALIVAVAVLGVAVASLLVYVRRIGNKLPKQ